MDIGKRLKSMRIEAGFPTQECLAKASNVAVTTIAKYEKNRTKNPGIYTIERLMEPMGKTLKDFVE